MVLFILGMPKVNIIFAFSKPLTFVNEKNLKKEALAVFKMVQIYMSDRKAKVGMTINSVAQDIAEAGFGNVNLRDEIYIQLCKQISDNPRRESLRRGWELLGNELFCQLFCKLYRRRIYFRRSFIKSVGALFRYLNLIKIDLSLFELQQSAWRFFHLQKPSIHTCLALFRNIGTQIWTFQM